ncbi:MAG: PEGA domain-containing protein [Planctomycetota bacterium]
MSPRSVSFLLLAATGVLGGCVHRTITITSEPESALVWLNDREVGRTPLEVEFEFYGTYDVRLEREGFEPIVSSGVAKAPWWETVGIDLVAELLPFKLESRVSWHYDLRPADDDPDRLLERARDLRDRAGDAG